MASSTTRTLAGGWGLARKEFRFSRSRLGNFVAECQQGYGWNIYEYDNDICCRDVVEAVLKDPELAEAEELEDFRERVAKADRAFQALALDGVYRRGSEWWRRVILRQAGSELANDLMNENGVAVEIVDDRPKLP